MALAIVLVLAGLVPSAPLTGPAGLPPAIADYYRDYNFVTAFSLLEERQRIAAHRRGRPDVDGRLARIERLMRRLESQVDEIDPGIWARGSLLPLTALRADLLQVASVRLDEDKGEAWVELDVLALERTDMGLFVSRFRELAGNDRTPTLHELARLRPQGPFRVMSRERHKWVRDGDEWRRSGATYHFIGQ